MIWVWAKLKLLNDFAPQSVFMRISEQFAEIGTDLEALRSVCAANTCFEPHKYEAVGDRIQI